VHYIIGDEPGDVGCSSVVRESWSLCASILSIQTRRRSRDDCPERTRDGKISRAPTTAKGDDGMKMRSVSVALLTGLLLVSILATAGCSSGYGTTPPAVTPPSGTSTPTSQHAIDVTANPTLGQHLVDSFGMSLYWTTADAPGMSNVPDNLLTTWPVFYAAQVTVPSTLMTSDFGTITRSDGSMQTTFKGWPLYYYGSDTTPGDTGGQGLGGRWSVVTPGASGPQPS
jgi:predicted lipoprotein with Yx(FWY)xxD motif